MSEQQYKGESVDRIAMHIASPEFRQMMAGVGVTAAEAVERARVTAQNLGCEA